MASMMKNMVASVLFECCVLCSLCLGKFTYTFPNYVLPPAPGLGVPSAGCRRLWGLTLYG